MLSMELEDFVVGHHISEFSGPYINLWLSGDNGRASITIDSVNDLRRLSELMSQAADYLENGDV